MQVLSRAGRVGRSRFAAMCDGHSYCRRGGDQDAKATVDSHANTTPFACVLVSFYRPRLKAIPQTLTTEVARLIGVADWRERPDCGAGYRNRAPTLAGKSHHPTSDSVQSSMVWRTCRPMPC